MTNLEELERLHAGLPVLRAETWNHEDGEGHASIIAVVDPEDWCEDEHPEAYNIAVNGVHLLNALPALIAEVRGWRSQDEEWRNSRLPEDDAIAAAHPTKTGNDTLFAEAHRMVTSRRSKPGLVALVNWLLSRAVKAEHNAEVEFAERKRIAEASDRAIIAATEKTLEHLEARMRAETQRDEAMAIADRWKSQAELATTVGDITVRNSTDATKLEALLLELRALRDAAEAARDYVENYGGDNENDRTRRRALAAALAEVPR